MHPFFDYVYEHLVGQMRSWPAEPAKDICLLVCDFGFDEDDPRRGFLSFMATTPEHWSSTYTPDENDPGKKWYTMLMTPFASLDRMCEGSGEWYGSDDPGDTECVAVRDDYFRSLGIFVSDEEDAQWYPLRTKRWRAEHNNEAFTHEEAETLTELEQRLDALPKAFIGVCADSVRRLFESGIIEEICGKPVPVVFFISNDMGDEQDSMQQMRGANQPGLTEEYYQWRKKHFSGAEQWPE